MTDKRTGWIGVDLDGTLAHYDEWRGDKHIGPPIPEMVERIHTWLVKGQEVRIFTARVSGVGADRAAKMKDRIQNWLEAAGLPRLDVTNVKDYAMVELWDDRAVTVVQNTGKSEREVLNDRRFDTEGFSVSLLFESASAYVRNPIRLAGQR